MTRFLTSLRRKVRTLTPERPGRRYNIFCGSNTWGEWLLALRLLVSRDITDNAQALAEYERRFGEISGTRHAVSFGAGRMALFAILEALGITAGDEIVIPAFTCVVVPNAILYSGAKPIYVDIEPSTFNIDVAKIEAAITRKTKALYAQHTFGLPCDVAGIRQIAARHHLAVIEDGALALGSATGDGLVGSLGDVAFFSTDHTKTISTHLGGMAVTNDPLLAGRLRSIQQRTSFLPASITRRMLLTFLVEYALFAPPVLWIGRSLYRVLIKSGVLFYFSDELQTSKPSAYPYPCRLSSAQAEIGIRQLIAFQGNAQHRRAMVDWLESRVQWNTRRMADLQRAVLLRYSFLVQDRPAFEARFANRFDLGIWFTSVVHCRDQALDLVGYEANSCPVAEYVTRHIVNVPTHPRIPLTVMQQAIAGTWSWLETQIVRECPIQ